MPIIVVGMHRSGTSLVAGLLHIAGVALGDESQMLPDNKTENEKGFWENVSFLEFNERILKHFGGAWYDPPTLPDGWLDIPQVKTWEKEAAASVAEQFSGMAFWAWKEPRTSILLPFWRSVVPAAAVVVCFRNPLGVAGSLAKRNVFSLEHSVALWQYYTLQALVQTDHSSRIITSYESILSNPRTSLQPVFEFCGIAETLTEAKWAEIEAFVSKDLQHHGHTEREFYNHPEIPKSAKDLYCALTSGDKNALEECIAEADQVLRSLTITIHRERRYFDTVMERNYLRGILNTRIHRLATKLSLGINKLRGKNR